MHLPIEEMHVATNEAVSTLNAVNSRGPSRAGAKVGLRESASITLPRSIYYMICTILVHSPAAPYLLACRG